jgi:hypothetical protein
MEFYENRLVAMLDVLGFSAKISRASNLPEITQEYAALLEEAKIAALSPVPVEGSHSNPPANFEMAEFVSDTLVLVSKPIDPHSVGNFILTTCLLMERFFSRGYPLRGAISMGSVTVEKEPYVFLSDVFKRLSGLSDALDWTGCVVLPEAETLVLENLFGDTRPISALQSSALHRVRPPWKKGKAPMNSRGKELWCLNWSYFLKRDALMEGLNSLKGDQKKFAQTESYIKYLQSLPDDSQTLSDDFAPAKVVKCMKARSGAHVAFLDSNGDPAQPNTEYCVAFT